MYYLIDTILRNCSAKECHSGEYQYVAVLSPEYAGAGFCLGISGCYRGIRVDSYSQSGIF